MKYLVLACLFLVGCDIRLKTDADRKREALIDSDLLKYEDKENGVICYRIRNKSGIDCFTKKSNQQGVR